MQYINQNTKLYFMFQVQIMRGTLKKVVFENKYDY